MNGHTDDEIKRQRLHYSSDQLYSVSIFTDAINFFYPLSWYDMQREVKKISNQFIKITRQSTVWRNTNRRINSSVEGIII